MKFKLYTVPGQVVHDSTRKAVLSRADGVVFVADSQRTQSVNNGESFANLEDNAARVGIDFDRLPLVVQFNKRDMSQILSEEEVMQRWKAAPWPVIFSSALEGRGVLETFHALLLQVYDHLNEEFDFLGSHALSRDDFIRQSIGNLGGA